MIKNLKHRSSRIERIAYRRCRRCNWRGPAYLDTCRQCSAAMGEAFDTQAATLTIEFDENQYSDTCRHGQ